MHMNARKTGRRQVMGALALALAAPGWPALAQPSAIAFPVYRAEDALEGVYRHHLPPLLQAFVRESAALARAAHQHCADGTLPATVWEAWRRARLAWMAVSNPALGPVITRRSQRGIDFWPVRPALLQRALARQPQTLAQMRRVGGPAKGFPTLEHLLATSSGPAPCPYLGLVAQGIEAEAAALQDAFGTLAAKDWAADPDAARPAFAEWVNQWLGGLEQLRWQQIEQPLQRARSSGSGQAPAFARRNMADNLADWAAQWRSLQAQARLAPWQRTSPPVPGQALVPIEALLLGKGQIALAARWGEAVDRVSAALGALPPQPDAAQLMALSGSMKALSALYQGEVAPALDVPLGFSSADGD